MMNPKTRSLLFLLVPVVAVSGAVAQNRVVPTYLTEVEGNSYFDFPFLYDKGHFQQIWEGAAVCGSAGVIQQVSFRRDSDFQKVNYSPVTFVNTTVSIGSTPVTPATMSTNFATNLVGAVMTTVINGANYNLPAQGQYPLAPFNIHYVLPTPFVFSRNNGNLMMEWIVPGTASTRSTYSLDGDTPTLNTGQVRSFGSFGKLNSGDDPTFTCDQTKLVPGGSIDLTIQVLTAPYTAMAFFDISDTAYAGVNLPFDLGVLGAPGNTLYTGRLIEVPMPVIGTKLGYAGRLTLPLPNNPTYSGYRLFAQTWFADKAANALGIVTSNGLELIAGSGNPITRILGQTDSVSTAGYFEKGTIAFGGPVVKFTGAIN